MNAKEARELTLATIRVDRDERIKTLYTNLKVVIKETCLQKRFEVTRFLSSQLYPNPSDVLNALDRLQKEGYDARLLSTKSGYPPNEIEIWISWENGLL